MEQYSNLNVHGKITQKAAQGTNSDDVVKYPTLTERVPATLPTPAAANEGKAIISNGSGYEFGEAGKVDAVQINGTAIAGDGAQTKIANVQTGTGLESDTSNKIRAKLKNGDTKSSLAAATTSSTASRQYAIEPDSSGYLSVNIPWTDHITTATDSGTGNTVTGISADASGALTITKGNMQTPLTAGTDYVAHNSTTASQVYATNGSKVDTPVSFSTGATQGHIVQRGTGGQITVPSTPSADTDAASKAFVNSSVSTNTATFRGTYNAVSDLGNTQAAVDDWVDPPTSTIETLVAGQIATKLSSLSITPTNNDYTFVSVDQTPVGDLGEDWYWRFKYNGSAWEYEYTLNNSSFTQAQWDAVNSGITADKVSKLDGIEAGAEVNVQADWNQTSTSADDYIKNKPTFSTGLSVSNTNVVAIASTTVTSGSYGPTQTSATTLAYSGTFKVPKYTVDADGRLTASGDIQFTLPASDNTDAKVQQKGITTNGEYPILLKYDTGTSDVAANYVNFGKATSAVPTINPSTGNVTAPKVNGLTLTAASTGFTIAGGTTSKTLTVGADYTLAAACAKAVVDATIETAISSSGTSLPTERKIYHGLPKINNAHNYTSNTDIYAPVSAGTSGQALVSGGSGTAPTWANAVGKANKVYQPALSLESGQGTAGHVPVSTGSSSDNYLDLFDGISTTITNENGTLKYTLSNTTVSAVPWSGITSNPIAATDVTLADM